LESYIDFELRIDEARRGFVAHASVEGLGEGHHDFSFPFDEGEWSGLLEAPPPSHREVRSQAGRMSPRQRAEKTGRELFNAVFGGEVQRLWRRSLERASDQESGVRLRLRLRNPVISSWPWEYLFDPERNEFLVLSTKTPIIRYAEMPVPVRPLRVVPPLRMLVVIATPWGFDRLDAKGEWEELRHALGELEREGEVVLELLEDATLSELRRRLRKTFHIVHFICHGSFDLQEGEGALVLEDGSGGPDRVTGPKLAMILGDRKKLCLVVLNSCNGAKGGASPFTGVAQNLVRKGIPAVVAMRSIVTDAMAVRFARHFYQELAGGSPVEEALTEARRAMFAANHEDIEWGTPILFLRSLGGRIFRLIKLPAWLAASRSLLSWRTVILNSLLLAGAMGLWWLEDKELPPSEADRPRVESPAPDPPVLPSKEGCPASELLGMTFVRIEPRPFQMGWKRWAKHERRHEVRISQPFCMGVYEVTQGEWEALMGPAPGTGPRDHRLPVTWISSLDVAHFIEALNEREPGAGYRLPTEAEWEYAARAGASTRFNFGDTPAKLHLYGNCKSKEVNDRFDGLAPVGKFKPNRWGLYDMHGNVSEWVQDWYGLYPSGQVTDPKGPPTEERRVRRGGSFAIIPENCDAVRRTDSEPNYRSDDVGFRLVREVIP
jgi:Sulfatase-modifying factor enzyme 1/CHAT domain